MLTTTLSHEAWFVHSAVNKGAWCLRSFLEGPEGAAATAAAVAGSGIDDSAPGPRGGGGGKRKPAGGGGEAAKRRAPSMSKADKAQVGALYKLP